MWGVGGRCLVSKRSQARLTLKGRKVEVDPRDSFVPHCKVAPRRLADSGTGVLKGGRIGSKHRWTLDREWRGEDGRAQGVSAQVVSGDTGKKGAMSRFE